MFEQLKLSDYFQLNFANIRKFMLFINHEMKSTHYLSNTKKDQIELLFIMLTFQHLSNLLFISLEIHIVDTYYINIPFKSHVFFMKLHEMILIYFSKKSILHYIFVFNIFRTSMGYCVSIFINACQIPLYGQKEIKIRYNFY